MFRRAFQIVLRAFEEFARDEASLLGAGISFYALFSVAPLLIFGVGVIGLVLGDEAAQGLIVSQVDAYVGRDVAKMIQEAIAATRTSEGGIVASIVGGLVVLYGGHNIFVQMRRALNVVQGMPPEDERPGVLKAVAIERGISILALFILGGIFVSLAIATLAVNVVLRSFEQIAPIWRAIATPIDFLVTFAFVTGVVAIIYRVLPTRNLAWKHVLPGAALVGVVFFVVKYALGLYLAYASVASAYGAAGSLVALMLWVFVTSLAILFGAELNQVLVDEVFEGRAATDEQGDDVAVVRKADADADADAPEAPQEVEDDAEEPNPDDDEAAEQDDTEQRAG